MHSLSRYYSQNEFPMGGQMFSMTQKSIDFHVFSSFLERCREGPRMLLGHEGRVGASASVLKSFSGEKKLDENYGSSTFFAEFLLILAC